MGEMGEKGEKDEKGEKGEEGEENPKDPRGDGQEMTAEQAAAWQTTSEMEPGESEEEQPDSGDAESKFFDTDQHSDAPGPFGTS